MPYCLGITPSGLSDLCVFGLLSTRCSFYGRVFLAFNVSQRIPISTFGHSNACRQSRRADCGLLHACLRSSAACAFCGVLCVLDGFVMKCPKVETMDLDGVKIPGSVNFGGVRSPFWWCAELVLTARGLVALCFLGSDEQICLRETTIIFTCGGAKNKKDAPKGALHANKFPRRGAPHLRRQCA